MWRLYRRKADRIVETREEFLKYPQTSPEIYEWLPYHRDEQGRQTDLNPKRDSTVQDPGRPM